MISTFSQKPFYLLAAAFVCISFLHTRYISANDNQKEYAAEINGSPETIVIDGETHEIPPPWAGNKVTDPKLTYEDFKQIPVKYTLNNSKLYIVEEAHAYLVKMLKSAEEDGIILRVESGYRSAGYQRRIYKRMISEGRTFDDIVRYVAPPGYSNHMLGTAVDFYPSNWRFADTEEYTWLKTNGSNYFFEEVYSENNPKRLPWEAWHWQYIAPNHAKVKP